MAGAGAPDGGTNGNRCASALIIAGHQFTDQPHGRVCDWCGRRWLDILAHREFWRAGEAGIAHSGLLSTYEVNELNAELDRIWATVVPTVA